MCAEPTVDCGAGAEKASAICQLWAGPQLLPEFPVALGSSPLGHKQQEATAKTPEGRYVLDYRKADSAFYKALHVFTPNARPGRRARGESWWHLIAIHGQKNGLGWLAFLSQRF